MKIVIASLWPTLAAFALVYPSPAQELGTAPRSVEEEIIPFAPRRQFQNITVNPTDRAAVIDLYRNVYLASESVPAGWTGNRSDCNAGATSQAYADATLRRVNYYRAMAGLPGSVTLSNAWNNKCQQAALMMSAAGQLSHSPGTDWPCSTADGREAAGRSNLALGAAGPDAIDLYMDDHGSGNSAAGHRRWILYPPAAFMGSGSIPSGGGSAANALWVIGGAGSRPATPVWVAWPPPGFIPYQVLPARSQRWSFSYPGASFSSARVFMQRAGAGVTLTIEPMAQGYGDNTIVWVPQGVSSTAPATDITYTVIVSNVVVSSQARQFTYEVTIMDPEIPAPPTITSQPESRTNAVGDTAVFSVTASGTGPLSYQWRKNGIGLVNGGRVNGVTSTSLVLSNVQTNDFGNYDVVVSSVGGSATSAPPATLWVIDTVAPTVAILSPAAGSEVGLPSIQVTGTATDNVGVAAVEFKVISAAWTNTWQPALGTVNWTAQVTSLYPGTNLIRIRARDGQGNVSPATEVSMVYLPRQELTLTTTGAGTITPFPANTNLVVGMTYTLTAVPAPGFIFSTWSGAILPGALSPITNSPQVTFLMQTGLWLQANFVVSPFLGVKGTYHGLFYETNGVRPESSGFFTLALAGRGGYTAKLQKGGAEYSTSGQFGVDGKATNSIVQSGTNCLAVEWTLDLEGTQPDALTGRVLDCSGAWAAGLLGDRAPVFGLGETSRYSGKYTLVIPGSHDPARSDEPAGDGFGAVTVATNGLLSLNGVLADGKVIIQNVLLSTNGLWPLYVSLYGGGGSLLGWVQVNTNPPPDYRVVSERISWIKPVKLNNAYYPGGFSVETVGRGSSYKAKNGLPFTNGILVFVGGGLEAALTNCITLAATNTAILCGSGTVMATITRSNGTFSGTFTLPNTNTVVTFKGAVLQKQGWGAGFFKNAGQSGQVYLGPEE
jgi:hypothetical protein